MILQDFLKLLSDSVQYTKMGNTKTESLQTYAHIESYDDLTADNLGKNINDKYKGLFYSRKWELNKTNPSKTSYDYPALLSKLVGYKIEKPFSSPKQKYEVELAFCYPYFENHSDMSCPRLTEVEIEQMTINFAIQTFQYLKDCKFVTIQIDANTSKEQWVNSKVLDMWVTKGTISSYNQTTEQIRKSKAFEKSLIYSNKEINGGFLVNKRVGVNLYGVVFNVSWDNSDCKITPYQVDEVNCCTKI